MKNSIPKIIVGLSGGVDSSVTALLLKNQGFDVSAMFMKNWVDLQIEEDQCSSAQDLQDAEKISQTLAIEFHSVNYAPEYWDRVFTHFLDEYKAGRTPNPDVLCNKEIKFDVFLKEALSLGAEKIATGHYARVTEENGKYSLLKAIDSNKDQSYFLHALNQEQLSHALFPLGEMLKPEVRELAKSMKLETHDKKDSTGICFIGEKNFTQFLSQFLPAQPGEMQTPEGKVIAIHQGLMYYTLGQRKGLGIGGLNFSESEEPWYVIGKRIKENVLVIVQGHNHPLLFSSKLEAIEVNWISGELPSLPLKCSAKTRYRQIDQDCIITPVERDRYTVEFIQAQRAVTPGQYVVFYDGDNCLGGGVIDKVPEIIYQ